MTSKDLFQQIKQKRSFLCIGLDSDPLKIPKCLNHFDYPVFEFNKQIIDNTHDLTVAYKPNVAFYEANGTQGWQTLEKTVEYIKSNYPEIFVIADAKRGDIGNTSAMYARAFFEKMNCDAVTVAPYMGNDSVMPFLDFDNKWVLLLALTSNKGAFDFQFINDSETQKALFETVIEKSAAWGNKENMMYVVGATKAENLKEIRLLIPDHFLLVPGVGAQGGSLAEVVEYGMNNQCGLLVNASRSIIFAGDDEKFATKSRESAKKLQTEMAALLNSANLL